MARSFVICFFCNGNTTLFLFLRRCRRFISIIATTTIITKGAINNSPIPIPKPAFGLLELKISQMFRGSLLSFTLGESSSLFPDENARSLSADEDVGSFRVLMVCVVEVGRIIVVARSLYTNEEGDRDGLWLGISTFAVVESCVVVISVGATDGSIEGLADGTDDEAGGVEYVDNSFSSFIFWNTALSFCCCSFISSISLVLEVGQSTRLSKRG